MPVVIIVHPNRHSGIQFPPRRRLVGPIAQNRISNIYKRVRVQEGIFLPSSVGRKESSGKTFYLVLKLVGEPA